MSNKSRTHRLYIFLILFQLLIIAVFILVKWKLGISDIATYKILNQNNLPIIEIEGYKSLDENGKSIAYIKYFEKDLIFEEVVDISIQGGSSIYYPKKNYNIDVLTHTSTDKSNIHFSDWYDMDRYCLKANFVDFSMARNTVAAKLWGDIVESRERINPYLDEIINYGAVDGFPVALYLNGKYNGIYNINTSKDCLFDNMQKGKEQAVLFGDNLDSVTVQLKETSESHPPNGGWQLIYNSEDNTQWITESFNQLIDFSLKNNDEEFRQGINEYLDVEAAIDYLIFYQFLCLVDNQYKNMIWVTYDGKQWMPSAYDLDKSFGLDLNGVGFFSTDRLLPYYDSKEQTFYANSKNALWNKLINTHREEIAKRYFELRHGALSIENISSRFNEFNSKIPQELFEVERKLWPTIPSINISDISTILDYQTQRAEIFDKFYSLYAQEDGFGSDRGQEFTRYTVCVESSLSENKQKFKVKYNQVFDISRINSNSSDYEFDKLVYKDSNEEFVEGTKITHDTELKILWKEKQITQVSTQTPQKPVEEKILKAKFDEYVNTGKLYINKIKLFIKETRLESLFISIFAITFIIIIIIFSNMVRKDI